MTLPRTIDVFRSLREAIERTAEPIARLASAFNLLGKAFSSSVYVPLLPHVIQPNDDLACTICGFGPEEH